MRFLILIIILNFCCVHIHGQSTGQPDSNYFFSVDLDSIVIKPSELKLSATSYDRILVKENKISSAPRIEQYLNFLPGIEMQAGALNTSRIHIRGIGSRTPFATNKIRAYLDDLPLTDGIGETSIEDLNLSIIENIEVWKGPFRSAYGSQLGGAIRYRTEGDLSSLSSYVETNNSVGDYGYFRTDNSILLGGNNQLLLLNFESLHSDGYRDNNIYQKGNGNLIYKRQGRNRTMTILFSHIDLRAQIPSSININDYNEKPSSAAANWKAVEGYEDSSKARLGININQQLSRRFYISSSLLGYAYNAFEVRPFNVLDDNSKALSIRNRLHYNYSLLSIEIGQEWYRENYNWDIFETVDGGPGNRIEENSSKRTIFNIFSEAAKSIGNKMDIGLGIHYSHLAIDLNRINSIKSEQTYDPIWSPRLYAAYNIKKDITIRVDLAHGYSNVGLDESLNQDGTFNDDINREIGWNYELGIRWNKASGITGSLSIFRMNVNDIIVNRQDDMGRSFGINAGKSSHQGIEWSLNFRLLNKRHTQINLTNNTSIGKYKFEDFIDGGIDYSGNDLTGVASNKTSSFLSLNHHSTNILLWHRYTGPIPINDANEVFNNSYSLLGFRFSQGINISPINIEISAEMDNILDHQYASMVAVNASAFGNNLPRYYYPGLPRNSKMTISLKYLL